MGIYCNGAYTPQLRSCHLTIFMTPGSSVLGAANLQTTARDVASKAGMRAKELSKQ